MEKWRDLSHVFFNEADFDRYLVIRRQRDRTCYTHSVIALVHYLCIKRSGSFDHKMLDMSTFMRENMDRKKLKQYIIWSKGGDILKFFREITGLRRYHMEITTLPLKHNMPEFHKREALRILNTLKERGEPALVVGFMAENCFVPKRDAHVMKSIVA
jgi:hypothetical protein